MIHEAVPARFRGRPICFHSVEKGKTPGDIVNRRAAEARSTNAGEPSVEQGAEPQGGLSSKLLKLL